MKNSLSKSPFRVPLNPPSFPGNHTPFRLRANGRVKSLIEFSACRVGMDLFLKTVGEDTFVRDKEMMKALIPAAQSLQISVKFGIKLLAQTAALYWSVEHMFCNFDVGMSFFPKNPNFSWLVTRIFLPLLPVSYPLLFPPCPLFSRDKGPDYRLISAAMGPFSRTRGSRQFTRRRKSNLPSHSRYGQRRPVHQRRITKYAITKSGISTRCTPHLGR